MSAYLHYIKHAIPAGLLASMMAMAQPAAAEEMTAGSVLTKMKPAELTAYLAGIAEGLAYARYVKDGNTTDGMGCINKWFYEPGTMREIFSTFNRFPDHSPGAVMAAMTQKACGA